MCSYDFAWHPDVKDGKIHALHCDLNDLVLVCVYIYICESFCVYMAGCVCECACICVRKKRY